MDKFWSLLKESVILQGVLSVCFVGTICYLAIAGRSIPEILVQGMMLILGFFFGAKSRPVEV